MRSREKLPREAEALFGLALDIAGKGAWNAKTPVRLLYSFLSPYRAERLLAFIKACLSG